MELKSLVRRSAFAWEIPRQGAMRVPAVIHASEAGSPNARAFSV
jgi:hypothetical protein